MTTLREVIASVAICLLMLAALLPAWIEKLVTREEWLCDTRIGGAVGRALDHEQCGFLDGNKISQFSVMASA